MREKILLVRVPKGGGGGRSLEPWSPEIFVVEPGAQSLSQLGSRTKMLFLPKWNPGVKQWSPRAPNFPSWSPGALHFLGRSPGGLNPFGTLSSIVTPTKSWVKALSHFLTSHLLTVVT